MDKELHTCVIAKLPCVQEYGPIDKRLPVEPKNVKNFSTWRECVKCGHTAFNISYGKGEYQLIARCMACTFTFTAYDG